MNQNACCVVIGSEIEPRYFAADQLEIAKWRMVREKTRLDRFSKEMIDFAKRNPSENQKLITDHALDPLGVKLSGLKLENVDFWTVSTSTRVKVSEANLTRNAVSMFKQTLWPSPLDT